LTKLLPLAGLSLVLQIMPALHAQTLSVDRQSLTFTAAVNGPPTTSIVNVTATSPVVIVTTVVPIAASAWLSVSYPSGATPVVMAVTVNPSALGVGMYTGSIVVSDFQGSSSLTVAVSLTVSSINVSPQSLTFVTSVGNTPLVQSVTLSAGQPVTYSAVTATTSGGNWLDLSPASGLISGYSAVTAIPDATVVPTLSAGTYNGTITITPTSGTSLTPVVVTVTLTVLPAPAVTVNPTFVNLEYQIGGTNNNAQETVTLTTPGAEAVGFTLSAANAPTPVGGTWVVVSPTSGSITSAGTPVTIGYDAATNLSGGSWPGTVTLNTPTGSPTTTTIPVTLLISTQPLLNVPGTTLNFSAELNSSNPPPQSVTITSTSTSPQTYSVTVSTTDGNPWLVAPTTGTTPGPLGISVSSTGLAPGTYTGTVSVTGAGAANGPFQIPVTLEVANDASVVANFTAMALPYQIGQTQAVSQAITVTSSNGAPLNFVATAAATSCGNSWLELGGSSGVTTGQVTVAIVPQGLAAGTCSGTVSIAATNAVTGAAAINSPLTIPVTLTVSNSALLVVSPFTPVVLTAQVGVSTQGPQLFSFTSSDSDVLDYTVAANTINGGGNWLAVSQANGHTATGFNVLGISVQPGQLTPGTYAGTVTVTASGPGGATVANSPLTIPVTFIVTAGSLVLSPNSLTFQQAVGGTAPVNQVVNITSTGQPLGFAASAYNSGTANWLTVSPSGATPGSISVGANGSGLAQGSYSGIVDVISTTPNAGNSPAALPVTLVVNAGTISASPTSLTFLQVQGGPPPAAQTLALSGTPGAISFQDTANTGGSGTWLSVSPASGSTPGTVQVGITQNSLAVGSYAGNVTIVAPGAVGSPLTIPVNLNVVVPHDLSASPTTVTFTAQPGSTSVQSTTVQLSSAGGTTSFSVTASGGAWLSASPLNGATPATIVVNADPTGLAAAAYSGTLTISSPNAISQVAVTVNLVVGVVALPAVNAIANAASYGTGAFAPGENIVIFGSNIGPPQLTGGTVTNGVVDTSLAATRVLFDGIPGPIIYALSSQTSVMVPYELSGRSTVSVVVEYQGVQSPSVAYNLVLTAPGIYSQNAEGVGPGAILNQDYSINLPDNPAAKGSVVSVYMTGEGYTPGAVDGAIATGALSPVLPVSATVGGITATVLYAGTSPGIVTGATQVNVLIPANAPAGSAVPIVITVGTGATAASTQTGITVAVQ
jgi:uncharacterized protein (TIGR03437 family)